MADGADAADAAGGAGGAPAGGGAGGAPEPLTGRRVLVCVGGGVAAYKAVLLVRLLLGAGAEVDVALTEAAATFVGPATFAGLTHRPVATSLWDEPDRVRHLELARPADCAVVMPATANLLGKLAAGIADDLVTTTLVSLTAPLVLAPAMHTEMWEHPAVRANVATLRGRGAHLVGPVEGPLAGGDVGAGRLAEPEDVLAAVRGLLEDGAPVGGGRDRAELRGRRVVVTAGGTREPIDPVRYLGNRSSGRMGYALAAEAARRGAIVDLVSAPTALATPAGVARHDVETAAEMRAAVLPLARRADVVIKAAAVADWRPRERAGQKQKKAAGGMASLELVPTVDILAELGGMGLDAVLVGFAAETHDVEAYGRRKLEEKRLDVLVANDVSGAETGFASEENAALILTREGARIEVARTSKSALAAAVLDVVAPMVTMVTTVTTVQGRAGEPVAPAP